ncbi:uncharacterized protein C6orf136 homolog [Antennarius striatus]|uniref:uncharacterized protein C6orf136 homolog n=1 Tax=Antennarius striatus TaxID=241820 RepID=UPI0035B2C858
MAVSRGGLAFCVSCVCSHSRRLPIRRRSWSLSQVVGWHWFSQTRTLSSLSWALAPPNTLRYQTVKPPALSHPFHRAPQPREAASCREDSLSVCVLVRQGEREGLHTLLEISLLGHHEAGGLLALSPEFAFPLTTVDGSREDDISIDGFRRQGVDLFKREHGCFRTLFDAERCPAPFTYGSHFYCFHCPGTEPGGRLEHRQHVGLDHKAADWRLLLHLSLCSHAGKTDGKQSKRDSKRAEQMAMMYERLRVELPNILIRKHDYSMYSSDIEFINGFLNTKTRGIMMYRLNLSLWHFLCLCWYAMAKLEVLKLTSHVEQGTIKARWRVRGIPMHSLLLRFYQKDKSNLFRSFDAFSTFYIGQDGLIHCHQVEKVMPAQPPVLSRITHVMIGALVALGLQEERPALHLILPSVLTQGDPKLTSEQRLEDSAMCPRSV